ncbi:MAG TPA: EAL domain-containing protein [Acidimicrobiia bacterium]|nr:EAL domain-containing protein [Acidimicrobiia bacterium]
MRRHASWAFLASAVAVALVYGVLPVTIWKEPLYNTVVTACVLATLFGVLWRRPAFAAPWWLVVGGIACIGVAEWYWFVAELQGWSQFPSWGEYLDLGGRVLLLLAVGIVAARRGENHDRTAVIDSLLVGIAASSVLWALLFRSYFDRADVTASERVVMFSYLALDVALLTSLVLLLLRARGGVTAVRLLTAGVAVLLAADFAWLALQVRGTYEVGHLLDVSWPVGYAFLAAAALHPTMGRITDTPRSVRSSGLLMSLLFAVALGTLPLLDVTLDLAGPHLSTLDNVTIGTGALAIAVCVMARFLSLVKSMREAAERGARRTEALVRESQDVIAIVNTERRVVYVSEAIEQMLGWPVESAIGMPIEALALPEEQDLVREHFDDVVTGCDACAHMYEMRVVRRDGSTALMEIVAANRLRDPDIAGVILTARDISERRRLEEELAYRAFHDTLTGLANRRLLLDHVTLAINNRRVDDAPASAVVIIDLDDFKAVNDSLGHPAGDDLLVAIAERLTRCVRPGDTVARLGGDEFALLLVDAQRESLDEVATRMLEILAMPLRAGTTEIATSASIGIRLLRHSDTAQLAVRDADIAMYSAKTGGKGRYAIFDLEMGAQTERRLALKADLRGAWRRGEISVAFQPIVDLVDGRLRGAEALMRWTHPLYGAVSPAEFVAYAEETGIIRTLGIDVLREAARAAAAWRAKSAPNFYISVNVSPAQLDRDFVHCVDTILGATDLDPHALVLEVTESVLVSDFDESVDILQSLRARGIRVAIDDFGTGYSSLSYARQLPVDLVKIDRSFTSDLGSDGPSVVPTILQLARTLRSSVVAEGVETGDQATALLDLGCTLGQGHLYAPALPEATFRDLVRVGTVPRAQPIRARYAAPGAA